MKLSDDQVQALTAMAENPRGENPTALPKEVARVLEQEGLIRFARVTRWARITMYRVTDKGRVALTGVVTECP